MDQGPFPITAEQLEEARRRFKAEYDAATSPFAGVRQSPATTARAILDEVCPTLSSFDNMVLAYAVTIKKVRVVE